MEPFKILTKFKPEGNSRYRGSRWEPPRSQAQDLRDRNQRDSRRPRTPPRGSVADSKEEGEIRNEEVVNGAQKQIAPATVTSEEVEQATGHRHEVPLEVTDVSLAVEVDEEKKLAMAGGINGPSVELAKEVMELGEKQDDDGLLVFDDSELILDGVDTLMEDDDEFQALTDTEVEEMDNKNEEKEEMKKAGEQEPVGDDEDKKKGSRKALFKPTSLAVGTSKKLFVQAALSPRKKAQGKTGKKQGEVARKKEEKGPLIPKPPSSKP
ncbi:Uncharacterized protein Rs2_16081 [Raphanus sativus]|uniref:Uncharacterized protein LOC108828965 n=1 Tax=Raphanus sativus TaxID=3726 RepID=A0A6J0LE22_RAPSA|nr:uncharacterized protein LOC108828965 [Raphanus sativus]KAJ4902130.1 Uncharacterized protein Rs2_16081 [Raphanus sativus]